MRQIYTAATNEDIFSTQYAVRSTTVDIGGGVGKPDRDLDLVGRWQPAEPHHSRLNKVKKMFQPAWYQERDF